MDSQRDRIQAYVEWLRSEVNVEHSYHNHKEMMAWVATALYVPAVVGLATVVRRSEGCIPTPTIFVVVVSVAAYVLIRFFLNMQFRMRWESADVVAGLMKASVMLLSGEVQLTKGDCQKKRRGNAYWPRFAYDAINSCSRHSGRRLKKAHFRRALGSICRTGRLDDRWKTELTSYALVVASTIVAIILVALT